MRKFLNMRFGVFCGIVTKLRSKLDHMQFEKADFAEENYFKQIEFVHG